MLEQLLDEATLAARAGDEQQVAELIRQMAYSPEPGVIDIMVKTLRGGTKLRQEMAILVIQLLGYPQNEPAIPHLIYHIGDPNIPGWQEAAATLKALEVGILTPYLVRALLDQDAVIHGRKIYPIWGSNVEGVCYWLTSPLVREEKEYVLRCCPALISILSQAELLQGPGTPDIDLLLDALETAGDLLDAYTIPTLIALTKKYHESDVGKHAKTLLATFDQEALAPYKLVAMPS